MRRGSGAFGISGRMLRLRRSLKVGGGNTAIMDVAALIAEIEKSRLVGIAFFPRAKLGLGAPLRAEAGYPGQRILQL